MCGLAGFLAGGAYFSGNQAETTLRSMGQAISHRGPDSEGVWIMPSDGVAFVHRRLAILDLSSAGAQPMVSACGRYVLIFNGEVYNHLSIRKALGSITWRGRSDTETLLAGFSTWGIRKTVQQAVGMFALAVWDLHERSLSLVRDRAGEKPLYYGWQGTGPKSAFIFGSDLAAFKRHPAFLAEINRSALSSYLRFGNVGGSQSIYSHVYKLPPASILKVSLREPSPKISSYWSIEQSVMASDQIASVRDLNYMVSELENLLKNAVLSQMISDVPVGAFLSGGVDSSTIVSLMQAQSSRPVKTFSIGFSEYGFNEAEYAKSVSKHLGTDHTELYVTSRDAIDVIPMLPTVYSEPFSDSSQIPTYLVSKLAKSHVSVSLSGDGGDELFGGYNRYLFADRYWSFIRSIPRPVRSFAEIALSSVSPNSISNIGKVFNILSRGSFAPQSLGDKVHKAAQVLSVNSVKDLYFKLIAQCDPNLMLTESTSSMIEDDPRFSGFDVYDDVQAMMVSDFLCYLPDDILVKVDRAAMSHSLETRVPFLDYRVVEFASGLPLDLKIRNGVTKWLLRQVLYKYVPRDLIERPKMGFSVPVDSWLRGPLCDWAEHLLNPTRLSQEGFFSGQFVHGLFKEHLAGKRNYQSQLWSVLMFQAWLDAQ